MNDCPAICPEHKAPCARYFPHVPVKLRKPVRTILPKNEHLCSKGEEVVHSFYTCPNDGSYLYQKLPLRSIWFCRKCDYTEHTTTVDMDSKEADKAKSRLRQLGPMDEFISVAPTSEPSTRGEP
ncbi:MAG: hypothetical protein KGI38_12370 [Thaumarchaeota archaeon]|nr:hypothetical protein [Nitrososphaerota archaeon]